MGDHFELDSSSSEVSSPKLHELLTGLSLRPWTKLELAAAIERDHTQTAKRCIREELSTIGLLRRAEDAA